MEHEYTGTELLCLGSCECYDMKDETENAVKRSFIARIRYLGASSIITIPAKIVRELSIKEGERVEIQIIKKNTSMKNERDENYTK